MTALDLDFCTECGLGVEDGYDLERGVCPACDPRRDVSTAGRQAWADRDGHRAERGRRLDSKGRDAAQRWAERSGVLTAPQRAERDRRRQDTYEAAGGAKRRLLAVWWWLTA